MAQYKTPPGVDPVEYLLRENANLTARIGALEGRRLSTWDRADHADIVNAVEGQHVVERSDEAVWYYSDGAWRQLTAAPVLIPTFFEITPLKMQWLTESGVVDIIDGFAWTDDATVPTGGYLAGSLVGDQILLGFPLGPYGSIWEVGLGYHQNTSGGTVRLEWGTTSIDEETSHALAWPADPPQGTETSIQHPSILEGSATPVSYYITSASDADVNTSGASSWVWIDTLSEFIIAGDDGSQLSANAVAITQSPWPDNFFNGPRAFLTGGGDPSIYWWLRIRITSAGPVRIGWINVYRRGSDRHKMS